MGQYTFTLLDISTVSKMPTLIRALVPPMRTKHIIVRPETSTPNLFLSNDAHHFPAGAPRSDLIIICIGIIADRHGRAFHFPWQKMQKGFALALAHLDPWLA